MEIFSRIALALGLAVASYGCGQAQVPQHNDNYAEAVANDDNCSNAATQLEMTDCFSAEYAALDKAMSDLYFSLPKSRTLLTSQRAWLAYRDAHCEYAHHATPDGSMYGLETALCKSDLTRQRIDTLREAKTEQYGAAY